MNHSDSKLAHGTNGSPQLAIENSSAERTAAENEAIIEEEISLIAELERKHIKFTKESIVFITRDKTGQIVWLERGNSGGGLKHILDGDSKSVGHAADFERAFGIKREDVASYLRTVISHGKIISNKIVSVKNRDGYERVYFYDGKYYVVTGIGSNGFIVSAYPKHIKEKKS